MERSEFVVVYVDPDLTLVQIKDYLNAQHKDGWTYVDGLAGSARTYPDCNKPMLRVVFRNFKSPCVCPREVWYNPNKIPSVCSKYEPGEGENGELCIRCEHQKECHGK